MRVIHVNTYSVGRGRHRHPRVRLLVRGGRPAAVSGAAAGRREGRGGSLAAERAAKGGGDAWEEGMIETWSKARVKGRVEGRVPTPAPVTRQGDARPSPKRTPSPARACKSHMHGSGRRGLGPERGPEGSPFPQPKAGLDQTKHTPATAPGAHGARAQGKAGKGKGRHPWMDRDRHHPSADQAFNEGRASQGRPCPSRARAARRAETGQGIQEQIRNNTCTQIYYCI